MSGISYNIHGQNVPDKNRLLTHLVKIKPPAVLVLDNIGLCREIKGLLSATRVIAREYGSRGDGDLHLRSSARLWLDGHAHLAEGGITLHVLNEPPFDMAVINWLIALLKLAAPRRIPLIVGNWSVGNPLPDKWPLAKELLKLIVAEPDLFTLGLHEYAGGVVTSGLYGGYPDNAGKLPGEPGGKNLVMTWPKTLLDEDGNPITRYHMGRFKFLTDYCESIRIKPPRIILTEHGFDDTSDIKAWLDTLKRAGDYPNIRGWKTLRNQWKEWFPDWSAERAYYEQLKWVDEMIYKNSPVEAQCIFCWGHSSKDWEMFDVADATEFQELLEKNAAGQEVSVPKPDNMGNARVGILTHMSPVNVRRGPGTAYPIIQAVVPRGELAVYSAQTPVNANGYDWYWVEVLSTNIAGWMALLGGKTFDAFFEPEPVTPPKPPDEEPPSDNRPEKIAAVVAALRLLADKLEMLSGE